MSKTIVTPLLPDLGGLQAEDQLQDQVATIQRESYPSSAANPSPSTETNKNEEEKGDSFQKDKSDTFKRASDDSLLSEKNIQIADTTSKVEDNSIKSSEYDQIDLEKTNLTFISSPNSSLNPTALVEIAPNSIAPLNATVLAAYSEVDLYEIAPNSVATTEVSDPFASDAVTPDSPPSETKDSAEIASVIGVVFPEDSTEPEPSPIQPEPTTISSDYETPSVITKEPTNSSRLNQAVADKNSTNSLIRGCWMPIFDWMPIFAVIEPLPSDSNLVVTQATTVDSAQAGQFISLSWTVQNQGRSATNSNGWQDEIYFSIDKIFGNEDDVYLSSFYYSSFGLAIDDSYTVTQDIYLSNAALGDGYLLIKTDAYNNQLETDETDNIQAIAFNITAPQDNLVVTEFIAPETAKAGQKVTLSWTVQNQGQEATTVNYWYDTIYFSLDNVLGNEDDVYLATVYQDRSSLLEVNGSYTATEDIYLSNYALGNGYLLNQTDAYNNQLETDETDNVQVIVFNITAPQDNLVVTNLIAPETAQAGQSITVSWTVQNQGQEATTANYWFDEVYFSLDDVLGNEDDVYLTSVYQDQSSVLAADSGYTTTQEIYLPNYAVGNGYLFVKTDAYNNQLETSGTDNTQKISFNVTVPETNLVVTDFTAPETAQAGQEITLSWTVENLGSEATTLDYWYDRLYFSTDQILDQNDYYYLADTAFDRKKMTLMEGNSIASEGENLIRLPNDFNRPWGDSFLADVYVPEFAKLSLGANESYTITLSIVLPDFVGEGYLFVETDSYNYQLETNESDNTQVLAITIGDALTAPINDAKPPVKIEEDPLIGLPYIPDPTLETFPKITDDNGIIPLSDVTIEDGILMICSGLMTCSGGLTPPINNDSELVPTLFAIDGNGIG